MDHAKYIQAMMSVFSMQTSSTSTCPFTLTAWQSTLNHFKSCSAITTALKLPQSLEEEWLKSVTALAWSGLVLSEIRRLDVYEQAQLTAEKNMKPESSLAMPQKRPVHPHSACYITSCKEISIIMVQRSFLQYLSFYNEFQR